MAVGLAGCGSSLNYAAIVDGNVVTLASLNSELAAIAANKQYVSLIDQPGNAGPVAGSTSGTYNKSFVAVVLDQEIQYSIIRAELLRDKALPTAAQIDAGTTAVSNGQFPSGIFPAFKKSYQTLLGTRQAEVDRFVTAVTSTVTTDTINQFYQSHQSDYATEACARHILVADTDASGQIDANASQADATKVQGLLTSGGDWTALAKQYSKDTNGANGGSAANGGVLAGSASDGCLSTSDLQNLDPTEAQSIVTMPINTVSAPLQLQNGYDVLEVTSRMTEPLDAAVVTDIHQRLAGQQLNTLVSKAKVKINPQFGTYDSTINPNSGQVTGVVPPSVNVPSTDTSGAGATGLPTGP